MSLKVTMDTIQHNDSTCASSNDGALHFSPSTFRDWVRNEAGGRFRPEAGRYHLYVMYGCPWAHRTLIVRALKGLEHAIDITAVHYHLQEGVGWTFSPQAPDPLYGLHGLRELYAMADPNYAGRITVPVLWDKHERTIVNNESSEIIRMLNSEFNDFATRPALDLYPEPLRPAIDRWNERIFSTVNQGAYCGGFTSNQTVYENALYRFFATLDDIDAHLQNHRYLVADQPTEADWRLFPTLIRFEWVYHNLFKCNLSRLIDYRNLYAYTRELYQWPGIAATINERHIRDGYFGGMRKLNPNGIIPVGPLVDFSAPHGRG